MVLLRLSWGRGGGTRGVIVVGDEVGLVTWIIVVVYDT